MAHETDVMKRSEQRGIMNPAETWSAVAPACDIYENADEFLVVADVPGAVREDLKITLDRSELSIVARRDVQAPEGAFLAMEYRRCEFRRRFAVPGGVDGDKVRAELKAGVLHLHLPKAATLKPRQISVQPDPEGRR